MTVIYNETFKSRSQTLTGLLRLCLRPNWSWGYRVGLIAGTAHPLVVECSLSQPLEVFVATIPNRAPLQITLKGLPCNFPHLPLNNYLFKEPI